MKMSEVTARAKALNIKAFGLKREELIRSIQRAEGNFDCFGTASDYCDQFACCFRTLCLDGELPGAKQATPKVVSKTVSKH